MHIFTIKAKGALMSTTIIFYKTRLFVYVFCEISLSVIVGWPILGFGRNQPMDKRHSQCQYIHFERVGGTTFP